jgi:hypothetical protein
MKGEGSDAPGGLGSSGEKQGLGIHVSCSIGQSDGDIFDANEYRQVVGCMCVRRISIRISHDEASHILSNCIVSLDAEDPCGVHGSIVAFESGLEVASVASALAGFGIVLRKTCGLRVEGPDALAVAVASNDLGALGALSGARDLNTVCFGERGLPESLVRRPCDCSLLEVAVGSGSVEMTKFLLEFHRAMPTHDTLEQAMSTGSFEMIKLVRERLPEAEFQDLLDLVVVAAEFHQSDVLRWLLRDAAVFEQELLTVVAVERKLADSLVIAFENGFRPWSFRTREASLKWRGSSQLEFVPAPEGFSSEGGWWTAVSGVVTALPAMACDAASRPTQATYGMTAGMGDALRSSTGEWTGEMSLVCLGEHAEVRSIVLPTGIRAIGEKALGGFEAMESVVFPSGCTVFGFGALAHCKSLKAVSLPAGCKETGDCAFYDCASLASVGIPGGCTTINDGSFGWCIGLTSVKIPDSCTMIGSGAFRGSSIGQVAIPNGCTVGMRAFECCQSLTTVTIGSGCTTIPCSTFGHCTGLTSMTLPSTLRSIGKWAFGNCTALAVIAVPRGCQLDEDAFEGSTTRVTEL